jgi:two-component system, NtrC family, response regulator AtoC
LSINSHRVSVAEMLAESKGHASSEFQEQPVQSAPEAARPVADPTASTDAVCFTLRSIRNRAEAQAIRQALGYSGWNRRRAARLLEISYRSLLLKIQQHKITRQTQ